MWRREADEIRKAAGAIDPPTWHTQNALPPLAEDGEHLMRAALAVPPPPVGWPVMRSEAFDGPAGIIVKTLAPHTEADRAALLSDLLVSVGNAIGPGPHAVAEGADHPGRLYVVIVGRSSKSRKGSSRANIRRVMAHADPRWATDCALGGLSSGEGLIQALAGEEQTDLRRLVFEPEFSRVLAVASRQGNTISEVLRQAWDGEPLHVTTRQAPLRVVRHHISVVAHTTQDELRRCLPTAAMANGFANRFLFIVAERSKLLPNGGTLTDADYASVGTSIADCLEEAVLVGRMVRSKEAAELWTDIYEELSRPAPGVAGALTARAEAQVLRLSVVYAALDGSPVIEPQHLRSAKAVWDYAESSVRFVFGGATGSHIADRLYEAIVAAGPRGMSGTEQRDLLARHASGLERQEALALLEERGLIVTTEEKTQGAPRRTAYATDYAPDRNVRPRRPKRP